ncbi:amidase [Sporosarcina pasteurii]|uniref:Glutamyl-tRNA(Gln) amidotransferase subunit A n=1 Tax=Sporosarcina pasteurii TaxID=1474 RepID=A0A380CGB8_SPOPA|nr:amidase [Sporosarcina pasteurii]MDS9473213.1 amidase [Sporosarcina pasteurii]QBQ06946.1 Asp-tRNA(Asn)/Glu-tRNA(Gln) amidotransferase GatCAB subunit A [Sporosarcina pasteurii]SUJ18385.1 Glutamyl-tRNA(Gln) amidotransferase subunit A [Sporosarcina pasteurii]
MAELAFMPAAKLAPLIESKQLSPVELTRLMLERIDQYDGDIRAYITPLPEHALAQARLAEREIMSGIYKGALHGIPMGIKDNFYTKDIHTTNGSKLFMNFIPGQTATAAEKLLGAGGIMLGKLNMHELAAGSTGTNPFFGNTRNPWNLEYMPGGSSGGSAASLAAGLATLATGTDTFGSIRLPAAMCGVYGLKPTYGLVSTYGVFPTAWSMDTAGPMARSVADLAIMLNYMAGFDPNDPASLHVPMINYEADLKKDMSGIKIGVPTHYMEGLDADVEKLFQHAMETLNGLGAEIKEIEIPELTLSTFAGYATVTGEAATFHEEWLKSYAEDYSQDIRTFFLTGAMTMSPQYNRAQQIRRKMTQAFEQAFFNVDILLGPTIPIATPPYSEHWVDQNLEIVKRIMPFTAPINLTGVPSLAVPMGVDREGLPAGMQFIGKHLSEKKLLQVGATWEGTEPLRKTLAIK